MNLKLYSILSAVLFLIIFGCNSKTDKQNQQKVKKESKSVINVPLSSVQIKETVYNLSNAKDTVLTYSTGSKINVPKNAFLDIDGNPVKGEVKLTYREFSNALDIYLGGIPMDINNSQNNQVLETAGMIDINAYSKGERIFVNPESKINVQLQSFTKGNDYNVYQLHTNSGVWSNLGKNKIEEADYNQQLKSIPQVPPMPKKASQFSFTVEDMTNQFPEIDLYDNVLFEPVKNKYVGFNSTSMEIKDKGNGIFNVTFLFDFGKIHKEQSVDCYLAFKEGKDYDDAIKIYQKKYGDLIKKRDKAKRWIDKEWQAYFKTINEIDKLGLFNMFIKSPNDYNTETKITRTLEINGFGFINCDRPSAYPQGANLIAKFSDDKGKELVLSNLVLMEKGRNALFRYTTEIKFDPNKENTLFGFTSDKKLAYLKPNDFKKITQTEGDYTFKMTVYPKELKTYEDICKALFN